MKIKIIFCFCIMYSNLFLAQETIFLPFEKPENISWSNKEKEYYSEIWNTQVITNVSIPSLQVYRPSTKNNNGAAVIIAPGGGFYGLSIKSEGTDAAEWLVKKGFTVFVLKYRLVPTGEDGAAEISVISESNHAKYLEEANKIIPYAIQDGASAVAYVRKHADEFGIKRNKIGFMGFSAGGTVSLAVALNSAEENKINFLAPIYGAASYFFPIQEPRKDAPPIFLVCASDDYFGLADDSIKLYTLWHQLGINAELHLYARGNHGFGMSKSGQPKDSWIERFYDWALNEKFIKD
jgi:acetyl esterase/lipase